LFAFHQMKFLNMLLSLGKEKHLLPLL